MQLSLHPNMAWSLLSPPRASQPDAGIALVAGARRIIKISASGPLQEIAADGRCIAQLRRGAGQKRFGYGRKAPGEIVVVGKIGIADQRADAHAAIGKVFDPVEAGKMRDVDKAIGLGHAAFHQIEKIGAGGEIDGARFRSGRGTASRTVAGLT